MKPACGLAFTFFVTVESRELEDKERAASALQRGGLDARYRGPVDARFIYDGHEKVVPPATCFGCALNIVNDDGLNKSKSWSHVVTRSKLCLSKISKCLSAWELVYLHNSRRCSFFSRHSSHLGPRSSGRVLPSGSKTWLYAIKSACSTGLQESAQN